MYTLSCGLPIRRRACAQPPCADSSYPCLHRVTKKSAFRKSARVEAHSRRGLKKNTQTNALCADSSCPCLGSATKEPFLGRIRAWGRVHACTSSSSAEEKFSISATAFGILARDRHRCLPNSVPSCLRDATQAMAEVAREMAREGLLTCSNSVFRGMWKNARQRQSKQRTAAESPGAS